MSWCLFDRLDVDSLKRELQVLSEQYSQKCLEIGELTQKAEEREQTLLHCQQEGKELLRKNQAREGLSFPASRDCRARSSLTQHSPSVKTLLLVHISSLLRFYHQKEKKLRVRGCRWACLNYGVKYSERILCCWL